MEDDAPLKQWVEEGSFKLLTPAQVLEETLLTVEAFDSPGTVFRMNHASNYLSLKGNLPDDREAMMDLIRKAMSDDRLLKDERFRAL